MLDLTGARVDLCPTAIGAARVEDIPKSAEADR